MTLGMVDGRCRLRGKRRWGARQIVSDLRGNLLVPYLIMQPTEKSLVT